MVADLSFAQHQEISEKPEIYKGNASSKDDTTTLSSAFRRGSFNGHFRYFFMSTQNQPGLSDYYANAGGGGLRYEIAPFHGFQFAVSGFFIFNLASSDLGRIDPLTSQQNRYEIGLFDIENPYNTKDIDRLEEFYLKYRFRNSTLTYGRQLINTPFINLQDGRMRPTGVEGFWLEMNEFKHLKIEGGWLYAISPRGTTRWYNVAESIGIFPAGLNPDGTPSQYGGDLESKGAFLLGLHSPIGKNIKVHAWDLFTENIFNTAMLQTDFQLPRENGVTLFGAVQAIRQDAVNFGGNSVAAKTYFPEGEKSYTFGAKAGLKNKKWEASVNYNRITGDGRYLMPREWGRDPFFTFLPRERNEGYGDVHAVMGKISYAAPKTRIKASLAAGYYDLPDVKNYRLNKYGMPSYTQVNADVRYAFSGVLEGMEAQLLVVGKIKAGETYGNKKYEFNKVNMVLYNFVLNYQF